MFPFQTDNPKLLNDRWKFIRQNIVCPFFLSENFKWLVYITWNSLQERFNQCNQLSLPFSFLWSFQGSSTPGNMTGCAWHCDLPCKNTQIYQNSIQSSNMGQDRYPDLKSENKYCVFKLSYNELNMRIVYPPGVVIRKNNKVLNGFCFNYIWANIM